MELRYVEIWYFKTGKVQHKFLLLYLVRFQ